ncbi:hypothetical protein [Clostridium estertheticum]|uniref:hypothetical protein n=1 Tax=Clostridium estertheticum TaxID=238834 RepID=UPI001C7D5EBC|nr:hypothetical protein [Clostridium estertheticum]MBX4265897.1 hypothetical protein [Clostridium estertheticum]WLC90176.1 hypothetical protein KTC95_08335 [Clostridium estertheticum]
MDEFISKEIEDIKLRLDLIFKQNCDMENQLEKLSTALLNPNSTGNYNKAVEEFLYDFMGRDK